MRRLFYIIQYELLWVLSTNLVSLRCRLQFECRKASGYCCNTVISRTRVRQVRGLYLTPTQRIGSLILPLLYYLKIMKSTPSSLDHVILSFQKNLDRFYFPAGINTWEPGVRFLVEKDRHSFVDEPIPPRCFDMNEQ